MLKVHANEGARTVAQMLGRSLRSVKAAAHRQRISLRRRGERRGSVLGQPRGVSIQAAIRSDVVDGRVDATALAVRMRIDSEAGLCPSCARRPATVTMTGLCDVCHLDRLTRAHLDEVEKIDAQRALDASRQTLCRARRAAAR